MEYLDFDKAEQNRRRKRILFGILGWIIQIVIMVGLAFGVIEFAVEKTTMTGDSMEATLFNEDKIIISRFSYLFRNPKRFDVIVFKQSGKEHSYYNIKRVIGLPGETIQIIDGSVYINETILEEPISVELMNVSGLAQEPITLEENEYFVLGDHRNFSEYSRFANVGTIVKDDIVGKAWLRISPNFAFISKLNLKPEEKDIDQE